MTWHKDFPKAIRIGCMDYSVEYFQPKDSRQYDRYGETLLEDAVFSFRKNMTDEQALNTVIHEILHAVWNDHAMSEAGNVSEEFIVTSLANGLTAVMSVNPKLSEWLSCKLA